MAIVASGRGHLVDSWISYRGRKGLLEFPPMMQGFTKCIELASIEIDQSQESQINQLLHVVVDGFFTLQVINLVGQNLGRLALDPRIEEQKIIEQVNEEYIEKQGKTWDEVDKVGRDYTIERGNKIISLSADENRRWDTAVKPILDEYKKNMKDKGLPGEEALSFYFQAIYKYQK